MSASTSRPNDCDDDDDDEDDHEEVAVRVSGGALRGRRIAAPGGSSTRPTGARLKKSLLDILAPRFEGARVLDLYAGAGALAIEALSRGAASAVLVERDRKAVAVIRRNLETLELESRAETMPRDVLGALAALRRVAPFDVVFADPPYRSGEANGLLERLGASDLLTPEGVVAVEHHHKTGLEERYGRLTRLRVVTAGESRVTLFTRSSSDAVEDAGRGT